MLRACRYGRAGLLIWHGMLMKMAGNTTSNFEVALGMVHVPGSRVLYVDVFGYERESKIDKS